MKACHRQQLPLWNTTLCKMSNALPRGSKCQSGRKPRIRSWGHEQEKRHTHRFAAPRYAHRIEITLASLYALYGFAMACADGSGVRSMNQNTHFLYGRVASPLMVETVASLDFVGYADTLSRALASIYAVPE